MVGCAAPPVAAGGRPPRSKWSLGEADMREQAGAPCAGGLKARARPNFKSSFSFKK
jgi:hypothetical protein